METSRHVSQRSIKEMCPTRTAILSRWKKVSIPMEMKKNERTTHSQDIGSRWSGAAFSSSEPQGENEA